MINLLSLVLEFVALIIFLIVFISFILWSIGNLKSDVPFVTCSKGVLKNIKEAFSINDDSVVYDLGCGDGRVLFYLSRFNKNAKYIGVETSLFPFLLSKIGSFINNKKEGVGIEVIKNDFFKQDLSNATHIFVYLFPHVMDQLLPKLESELKKGTVLVSLSFQFKEKKAIHEIDLKRNKYQLGRKLYVYQF